jgi:putative phosphoesterase
MRLAIISDVHGNVVALRRVIEHLRRQSPDLIINLGDCFTSPLWPKETFDELQQLNALTVRGNHDRWLGESPRIEKSPIIAFTANELSATARDWAINLPATLQISAEVFAVHGRPDSDTEYLLENDGKYGRLSLATTASLSDRLRDVNAELVLCGHSHLQHCAYASGERLVVNPGSVGCPRYSDNANPDKNEAGSPHARYAIATREHGRWSLEFYALAYDWSPVVERAIAGGHGEWASGFLKGTGFSE